jgi:hypothetical protein
MKFSRGLPGVVTAVLLGSDLPTAGNSGHGRRTLRGVGPVAVLLLLEDRRDDCPHRAC